MSNWYQRRLSQGHQEASGSPRTPTPPLRPPAAPPAEAPTESTTPHYRRPPASSLTEDTCPGCGSMNYMAPPGTRAKRCFDCGYPIQQSGSGVGGTGGQTDGTVRKATQVQSGGYHPTTIVGKVE